MPDLGDYTAYVLISYVITVAVLAVFIGLSVWRAHKVRRALEEIEHG